MKSLRWLLPLVVTASPALAAETASNTTATWMSQISSIFNPANYNSTLTGLCDPLMLIFQAVSVVIIIAGLITKIRKHEAGEQQLDGIATTLLLVAFIATIPTWRDFALQTGDSIADATGYRAVDFNTGTSPLMSKIWSLSDKWVANSSPLQDQVTEIENSKKTAGEDTRSWWERAKDVASGVFSYVKDGVANIGAMLMAGLRSVVLAGMCAVVFLLLVVMSFFFYLAEFLRYLLMYSGCVFLPVFIAGLSTDFLHSQSRNYIIGLVGIAAWPIGWCIGNLGTMIIVDGFNSLLSNMVVATIGAAAAGAVTGGVTTVTVAPAMAYACFYTLIAFAIVMAVWMLMVLFLAPVMIQRVVSSGGQFLGGIMQASVAGTASAGALAAGAAATVLTGGAAAPAIGAGSAAGAAGGGGGAGVGAGGLAAVGSQAVNQRLGSVLSGASRVMSVISKLNPEHGHQFGAMVGSLGENDGRRPVSALRPPPPAKSSRGSGRSYPWTAGHS